jgi:hypothetical protein
MVRVFLHSSTFIMTTVSFICTGIAPGPPEMVFVPVVSALGRGNCGIDTWFVDRWSFVDRRQPWVQDVVAPCPFDLHVGVLDCRRNVRGDMVHDFKSRFT